MKYLPIALLLLAACNPQRAAKKEAENDNTRRVELLSKCFETSPQQACILAYVPGAQEDQDKLDQRMRDLRSETERNRVEIYRAYTESQREPDQVNIYVESESESNNDISLTQEQWQTQQQRQLQYDFERRRR